MMESGETLLNNHLLGNRGGSLALLVGTIINVLVMEIGWTDVGSGEREAGGGGGGGGGGVS